ncbi:MAG: ABC transporter permease [Flavobacterium sp.]|nr:ABC transporter permease [Flavobacterium sp.]
MNFPFYIARRYLKSASKNTAINIINGIASLGIIAGALALFVVLSVFSGLKDFSLSFSNDFDPDLKLTSTLGKSLTITPDQANKINKIESIQAHSKIVEERVLFVFDGKEHVTYLKGVDSLFREVNEVEKTLIQGQWPEPYTTQVAIGYGIHQKLSLGLFDFNNPFEVYVPKPGKGLIENPDDAFNRSILSPVGIYAINEDLDSKYVFADIALAQELLGYGESQFSGIEFKLAPKANERKVVQQLEQIFSNVTIRNRAQLNDSLYKMLNTENLAVYLIFTLVIIVALFNLIGALIMMILDKKANLKTLYNLGTEVKDLRKIFLLQGTLLSVVGGIIGLVLGIGIVILQQKFSLIMITPTLAYPVVFTLENVAIVLATISILGFLASLIASSRVNEKLLR